MRGIIGWKLYEEMATEQHRVSGGTSAAQVRKVSVITLSCKRSLKQVFSPVSE